MTEIRELVERLGSGAVLTEDKMRVDLIETESLLFAASDAIVDLSSQVEALKAENVRLGGLADGYGKLDADYAIAEARVAVLEEALRQHQNILLITSVRTEAERVAPLWLEAADAACESARQALGEPT